MKRKIKMLWRMIKQFMGGNATLVSTIENTEAYPMPRHYTTTPSFAEYERRLKTAYRQLYLANVQTPKTNYKTGMIYYLIEKTIKCRKEADQIITQLEKKLLKEN